MASQIRIAGPKNSAVYFDSSPKPTAAPTASHHAPRSVSSSLARKKITKLAAKSSGESGVMIVVRPGTGAFDPAALYPLVSAVAWALGLILTRIMRNSDQVLTTMPKRVHHLEMDSLKHPLANPDVAQQFQQEHSRVAKVTAQLNAQSAGFVTKIKAPAAPAPAPAPKPAAKKAEPAAKKGEAKPAAGKKEEAKPAAKPAKDAKAAAPAAAAAAAPKKAK